ncbi:MAG: glycolate oxidase subunit GlcE [Acidocella sp. 20-63-7]|nr:MAG: glycolate oxidase subunit GlcE [Acidocella sp. 20-63-7]HQT46080.1 glycolate oxidase subunit GlcE [Acidocella sp.]
MITPKTETEVAEILRAATAPLQIQGNGTKASMLRTVQAAETLSTNALQGVSLYAPKELVMSAKAGTPLAEIETLLAANGQQMIAEPSHLFGEAQTIGGVIAANLSGPRRVNCGALRDHVLGVRAVNGSGEVLNFGGRVLKNVTGLDVSKLLTGSFGTLAVLTEISFKVLPASEATGTLVLSVADAPSAIAAMSAALGSPFSVSGAAYLPSERSVYLRIEDFTASVKYRCEKLGLQLGAAAILDTETSKRLWRDLRDVKILAAEEALWRLSVPPSSAPQILRALEPLGLSAQLDWGGGLIWLAGPADAKTHAQICAAAQAAGGVWWLMRAPESLRAASDVLPPEAPALAALRRRVQQSFDPHGILNPLKLRVA